MNVKTKASTVTPTLCVLVCAMGLLAQHDDKVAPVLTSPYKTAYFESPAPEGATAPIFSNGYLIRFKRHVNGAGASNVYLYNSSAVLEHEIAIWPPGTIKLFLASVDVGENGRLVFSGWNEMVDGSMMAFIAFSDLDGKDVQYVSTGRYLATQVAVSMDGSVWSVGSEKGESISTAERWENYDMLRHYSAQGILLDHFLPRWGQSTSYVIAQVDKSGRTAFNAYDQSGNFLASYGEPLWGPRGGYSDPSAKTIQSWLRVDRKEIVLFDGRSGIVFHCSLSGAGLTSHGVEVEDSQSGYITGFAVTSDGRIFATKAIDTTGKLSDNGMFELLQRNSPRLWKWSRVLPDPKAQLPLGRNSSILGADDNAIVSRIAGGQVVWSQVIPQTATEP